MRNDWYIYFISVLIISFFLILPKAYSETNTVSSTVVTNNTPPTANAPSVNVNNSDICKSAASAGVQTQILGIASGITVTDENCERIKLSRSLYAMGMKVAAVSALCQDVRIFDAMIMAGTPCPYKGKIGKEATIAWQENPSARPDEADAKKEFIAQCTQESNPKRDRIKRDVVGLFSKVVISKTKTKGQCIDEFYGK